MAAGSRATLVIGLAVAALAVSVISYAFLSGYSPHSTMSTTSSTSAIEFAMRLNSTQMVRGNSIAIYLSLNNTLHESDNINAERNWRLTYGPDCSKELGPYRIGVYNGNYGLNNFSKGTSISIFYFPTSTYNWCKYYVRSSNSLNASDYVFEPNSTTAVLHSGSLSWRTSMDMTIILNPVGISFAPGSYTIVSGDEWSHLRVAHFIVTLHTKWASR